MFLLQCWFLHIFKINRPDTSYLLLLTFELLIHILKVSRLVLLRHESIKYVEVFITLLLNKTLLIVRILIQVSTKLSVLQSVFDYFQLDLMDQFKVVIKYLQEGVLLLSNHTLILFLNDFDVKVIQSLINDWVHSRIEVVHVLRYPRIWIYWPAKYVFDVESQ